MFKFEFSKLMSPLIKFGTLLNLKKNKNKNNGSLNLFNFGLLL